MINLVLAPTRGFYESHPETTLINQLKTQTSKNLPTKLSIKTHPSFKPLPNIQFQIGKSSQQNLTKETGDTV